MLRHDGLAGIHRRGFPSLWQNRERAITPAEREAAREAFERTIRRFRELAEESPAGS
ncbi:hypothetical protein [Planctellipticum variicoloris]|uniref:hypothetical protein n=1 Tax=Planctellipticum variicoloris TaxID=3064265 RepID=UPI00301381C7|nr:hypothetical protein SH412_000790 [Planctomycetaceae bacterium SH412]